MGTSLCANWLPFIGWPLPPEALVGPALHGRSIVKIIHSRIKSYCLKSAQVHCLPTPRFVGSGPFLRATDPATVHLSFEGGAVQAAFFSTPRSADSSFCAHGARSKRQTINFPACSSQLSSWREREAINPSPPLHPRRPKIQRVTPLPVAMATRRRTWYLRGQHPAASGIGPATHSGPARDESRGCPFLRGLADSHDGTRSQPGVCRSLD